MAGLTNVAWSTTTPVRSADGTYLYGHHFDTLPLRAPKGHSITIGCSVEHPYIMQWSGSLGAAMHAGRIPGSDRSAPAGTGL